MDKLKITGGRPLHGHIALSGAKNAALPILFATLLTSEPVIIRNVPALNDVTTTLEVLRRLGVQVDYLSPGVLRIHAATLNSYEAPYELVKTMRASILALGPLLARGRQAKVSLPGGCAIGERPVDQHIKALSALGAQLRIEHGFVVGEVPTPRLQGCAIRTDMVTVGGTEQILMAACLAEGTTILENAALEPEIVDLANLLNSMGANISGHGTDRIVIEGVPSLRGTDYTVMPDRIEAGTFLCAVAATGGEITLAGISPDIMGATLDKLREAGLQIEASDHAIHARMQGRPKAVQVQTQVHPGFPTDMQAQIMALCTVAEGTSVINENIFENRYMHAPELRRLGAQINIDGGIAVVQGVGKLSGASVMATDLRASASLIVAALAAEGQTIIDRIYHLDRGYERIEEKLKALGAHIERIHS